MIPNMLVVRAARDLMNATWSEIRYDVDGPDDELCDVLIEQTFFAAERLRDAAVIEFLINNPAGAMQLAEKII